MRVSCTRLWHSDQDGTRLSADRPELGACSGRSVSVAALEGPPIEASLIRPQIFILLAIVAFGLLIERVGLAPAIVVVTLIAAYASREMRWTETVTVAVGLAALCVGLFIYLLGQPLAIWAWNF